MLTEARQRLAAVLTAVLTQLQAVLTALVALLRAPFAHHPCTQCACGDYTDEQLFMWMKERSLQPSYASEMLQARIIGYPLCCSRCKHPRQSHHQLQTALLTCDMMPNGGVVYVEQQYRQRIRRRRARFACAEDAVPDVRVDTLRQGSGRAIVVGDYVSCHYDALLAESLQKFQSTRGDRPFCFTVGDASLVPGWDRAVVGALVGSKTRVFLPASLAYGDKLIAGKRNVDIVFDIDIIAIMSN